MPAEDLVEQVYILDRSGSMANRVADVIGGFNQLIQKQKELPGRCNVTLVLFDADYTDWYMLVHDACDVRNVPPLTESTYYARAGTALRDAIGYTIDNVGQRLANTPEHLRPRKVAVSIFSDGEENSSKKYLAERIKGMIEHQKSKYSWDFTFVGTNQNAVLAAGNYGIAPGAAINFSNTPQGFAGGIRAMNNYMSSSRTSPVGAPVRYSLADRLDAAQGEDLDMGDASLRDAAVAQDAQAAAIPGTSGKTP